MNKAGLLSYPIFFTTGLHRLIFQENILNDISLCITKLFHRVSQKLIINHLVNIILLVSKLKTVIVLLVVKKNTFLDRLTASNLLHKSKMDMVLQKSWQMPIIVTIILFDLL